MPHYFLSDERFWNLARVERVAISRRRWASSWSARSAGLAGFAGFLTFLGGRCGMCARSQVVFHLASAEIHCLKPDISPGKPEVQTSFLGLYDGIAVASWIADFLVMRS
jgi:hypothetical protein